MGPSPAVRRPLAFDYCAVYPPIGRCFRKACECTSSVTSSIQAEENTCVLCTPLLSHGVYSVACRATSETAPTLLFLPEWRPEVDDVWGTNQTSSQHSMASDTSLPALLGPFIAYLVSLPKMLRPSVLRRVYTVPRLRRLLQMGAAIGWLQGNSSHSCCVFCAYEWKNVCVESHMLWSHWSNVGKKAVEQLPAFPLRKTKEHVLKIIQTLVEGQVPGRE